MATAAQLANAQGLPVLLSQFGESFRVGAGIPFTALRTERMAPDGLGGEIVRTALTAPAASVASLPNGTVLTEVETSRTARVIGMEDGPLGYINLIVAHEVR